MPGKFVVRKSGNGFRWNLLAANGKVIAASEHYETRRAALSGIESVKRNAAGATLVEVEASEPATEVDEAIRNLARSPVVERPRRGR